MMMGKYARPQRATQVPSDPTILMTNYDVERLRLLRRAIAGLRVSF
jgi:hypothetical protein